MNSYKSVVNCLKCGVEFEAYNSHIKRGRGRFCSKKCNTSYNYNQINKAAILAKRGGANPGGRPQTKIKVNCQYCNAEILSFKSYVRKFCNINCRDGFKAIQPYKKSSRVYTNSGANHYNWKGGKTGIRSKLMRTRPYKDFRIAVLKRDGYKCVICGAVEDASNKYFLHVDHIKPYKDYPELVLDVNNGRALCVDCHKKTDSWGVSKQKILTGLE